MWVQIFKIASQITHPVTAAVVGLVLVGFLFLKVATAKKWRNHPWLLGSLTVVILVFGLAPIVASTYLQWRGVYRVRVIVLGLDRLPIDDAHVTSSIGGEPKRVEGGWEFDIPPQTRPSDGVVMFFASMNSAFLDGSSKLILGHDYYPTITIQMASDTTAILRGVVLDMRHRPVPGATVSIAGYAEIVTTDQMGNFQLAAHAAEGQVVRVQAQKGQMQASMSVPAGRTSVELVVKPR